MRKGAENQGDTRTLTAYFSPRSKVKHLILEKSSRPRLTSSLAETPMKPSQVTNRLSHPPPRRMLPLKSPELFSRDRHGPPQQPPHLSGPPCSPVSYHMPVNRCLSAPQDRLGAKSDYSPAAVGTSDNKPQPRPPSISHPALPHARKDLSKSSSSSSHTGNDQATKSMATSNSGRNHAAAQRQESTKDKRLKQSLTSEKAANSNYSWQKRCREPEELDDNPKKMCLQRTNSVKAQTPKPAVGSPLSTSLVPPLSLEHSPVLGLPPKTTDDPPCSEPACGQSTCLTSKPIQPSKPCMQGQPPTGAKQAFINSSQNHILKLTESRWPPVQVEDSSTKRSEENGKKDKSSSALPPELPQRHTGHSPNVHSGTHPGHTPHSDPDLPVKTPGRVKQVEETRKSDCSTHKPASKSNTGAPRSSVERNKVSRLRRPVVVLDDIDQLFTPDPKTYVICQKTAKAKFEKVTVKSPTSGKNCSSATIASAIALGSSCVKVQNSTETGSPCVENNTETPSCSAGHPQTLPTVPPDRVKTECVTGPCSKDSQPKSSSIASSCRQSKDDLVKPNEKDKSCASVRPLPSKTIASKQSSTPNRVPSSPRQRQTSDDKQSNEVDPLDVELDLDLGLSFAIDLDLTQSSHSSEDEELISLQEMMDRVTKLPSTPAKGTFPEPGTPGHHSCQLKAQPITTRTGNYRNNLDQMLKEINTQKKSKDTEVQLLMACEEKQLRIAEYEEAEAEEQQQEEQEEEETDDIPSDHQKFLQRYSLISSAIREVPPGEVVFNLENFGRIFSQDTLQLRHLRVQPQGTAQKALLWSSPTQLRLHLNIGLFQQAYDCHSPCPTQVTRFLFKMMSVHTERLVSEKILLALCDIASTAAYQIVNNASQQFKVWVPGLADVALVLMNMGAAFITLFPFENLQPPFTEGDLLDDIYIKSESPSCNKEQKTFPEHNCNNILKYLSFCMGLCPRAYSDHELQLLLTVVGRVGLDSQFILQSSVELYTLQYKTVNNIRDWDSLLPRICSDLNDLTDDHHNMCLLVQMLPYSTRGKQLRQHLSLSMISKLLDGTCKYRPTSTDFQLADLRPYVARMQPSSLLRGLMNSSSRSQKEKGEDPAVVDQHMNCYYLCYSLLTLLNEACNLNFFPAHQKEQLRYLSYDLQTHVKCDIRDSEKCLYRSKVKDLVARIDTKWQMLLQRTTNRPYVSWQPARGDALACSQEEQKMDTSDDSEASVTEENPMMGEDEEEEEEQEEGEIAEVEEIEVGVADEEEENEPGDAANHTNESGRGQGCEELHLEMPEAKPQGHSERQEMHE